MSASPQVQAAYSARSAEYAGLFGDIESTHPLDRALVRSWVDGICGHVLDVGCGPGQWSEFIASCGASVRGMDTVPEFVTHAQTHCPQVEFALGDFNVLPEPAGSVGGVFSWYSLIHHDPVSIHVPLSEFARVLAPGGGLLIGFFEGPTVEPFEHAVTTAYRWPVPELGSVVEEAGFDLVETHTRSVLGVRPHGAIVARRRDSEFSQSAKFDRAGSVTQV